jgi:hypothetical protein
MVAMTEKRKHRPATRVTAIDPTRVCVRNTRVPQSACPFCFARLDAATSIRGFVPTPGSYSICLDCGRLLVFTADLELRKPTMEEHLEVESSTEFAIVNRLVDKRHLLRGESR